MSKTNNLTDFLTDLADGIRTKKNYPSSQKINPQNFRSEIESIQSGGLSLNIEYSLTPPIDTTKLWVRKDLEAEKVISKQNIKGIANEAGSIQNITPVLYSGEVYARTGARVGTYMYIMGTNNTLKKYDILSNSIIGSYQLSSTVGGSVYVAVGTDIYIFGAHKNTSSSYKNDIYYQIFDSVTDTVSSPRGFSVYFKYSSSSSSYLRGCTCYSAVGTDIYIFGGLYTSNSGDSYTNLIVKFDTLTKSVTTMSSKLYRNSNNASATAVGTNIYIFGGYGGSSTYHNFIQKYDTLTDTITKMPSVLYTALQSSFCTTVGTNIYIFGGSDGSNKNVISRYDTLTDTITIIPAVLNRPDSQCCCTTFGNEVYIFSESAVQRLLIGLSLNTNNLLLTTIHNGKEVALVNNKNNELLIGINKAYWGNSQNKAELVDAYIHNGTNWVNINTNQVYQ